MQKRVLVLSAALLALIFLAVGGTSAQAQDPLNVSIGLQVDADGSWKVIEFFGQPVELSPQGFNSMAGLLGLGFELPSQLVDPALVSTLEGAGIAQLTLRLEGEAVWVQFNERQLPQAKAYLQNLQPLLGEEFSEPYSFLTQLLKLVRGTVYVRFTPEQVATPALVEAMPEDEITNTIRLGATADPEGQLLSVGGFTRQDLEPVLAASGAAWPQLPGTVMGYLAGLETVTVDVKPGGMALLTDEEPVVELLWDQESRQMLLDVAGTFTGFSLNPQMLNLAETWLQTSHVNFALYVADTPQDDLLQLAVDKPITVAFTDAGLNVAGVGVPVAGLDTGFVGRMVQGYGIDQAMLCWQGTELRWLVNGMEMPYVSAGAGWLTESLGLLGWQAFPIHQKFEQLLAETDLPLAVLVDPVAEAPTQGCGAYQVAQAPEPTLAFAVQGTWNRQQAELALEEVDLPFGAFGMLPIGISAQLRFPAMVASLVPPTIDSVEASVGAGGISATVDAVDVGVHWDAELLSNLAEVADVFGVGPTIRQAIPTLNTTEINVDIEAVAAQ